MKNTTAFFMGLISSCTVLSANLNDIQIGEISAGGNGCLAGSISLSADQIVLSGLRAQVNNARKLDRKSCAISIPVEIPEGYQVGLQVSSMEGVVALTSSKIQAVIHSEAFWAGQQGATIDKKIVGPKASAFVASSSNEELVWSPCGGGNLRINVSAMLQSKSSRPASVSIDSINLRSRDSAEGSGALIPLEVRKCL